MVEEHTGKNPQASISMCTYVPTHLHRPTEQVHAHTSIDFELVQLFSEVMQPLEGKSRVMEWEQSARAFPRTRLLKADHLGNYTNATLRYLSVIFLKT